MVKLRGIIDAQGETGGQEYFVETFSPLLWLSPIVLNWPIVALKMHICLNAGLKFCNLGLIKERWVGYWPECYKLSRKNNIKQDTNELTL